MPAGTLIPRVIVVKNMRNKRAIVRLNTVRADKEGLNTENKSDEILPVTPLNPHLLAQVVKI